MPSQLQSKSFEAYFAARSTKTASSLDQIGRALRAEGLLPSGPRGRHAPRLEPLQLADFLIAACMAPSPAEAVQTVMDFGSLTPANKLQRPQQALFKELGIDPKDVNLRHYIACIFWAGWEDAQKHIESIEFRRLPDHSDLRSRFEAKIEGHKGWGDDFERASKEFSVVSYIQHSDAERKLMLETVTLGRDFVRGLFRASSIPS